MIKPNTQTSVRPRKFRGLQRRDGEKQVSRFIGKSSPTRGTSLKKLSMTPNETTLDRRYVKIKTIQRSFYRIVDGLLKHTKPGETMPASDDTQEMTETFF